jgi:hypothetical protein
MKERMQYKQKHRLSVILMFKTSFQLVLHLNPFSEQLMKKIMTDTDMERMRQMNIKRLF